MVYLPPPLWTRARRLALVGCCGLVLVLAALFQWHRRDARADPSSWDEARLARELESLGYRTRYEPADREIAGPRGPRLAQAGLYLARAEPADWDEVASRPRGDVRPWRGQAVATRRRSPYESGGDPREFLNVGPWVLYGDPAELDRISSELGLSR
jgi:hypothetical protein